MTQFTPRLSWRTIPLLMSLIACLSFLHTFSVAQTTVQIGSGTQTTPYNSTTFPIDNYHYTYGQQIVNLVEYVSGGGGAGPITKIRFQFPNVGSNLTVYGNWDVYIGHTDKDSFASTSDWVPISDLMKVYSGNIHTLPLPPTNGQWFEIEFATPFNYNATDNIVVAIHERTPQYISNGLDILTYNSTPNTAMMYHSDTADPNPTTPPNASKRNGLAAQIQFEGTVPEACAGNSITAGNISLSTSTANGNTPYKVTSKNFSIYTGLSFQWIKSTDGGTTWNPEGSATPLYAPLEQTASPTIGDQVQYKLTVQCNTDPAEESNIVPFTTGKEYCTPEALKASKIYFVSSFSTTGAETDLTPYSATDTIAYIDNYATNNVTAYQGSSFNFNFAQSTSTGYFYIWVDYNDNGTFGDTPEEIILATTSYASATSGTITIPGNITAGDYRMRIANSYSGTITPCGPANYGNYIDFKLIVQPPPTCTGEAISAGTVTVSLTTANAGTPYNVTATGYSIYTGLTFQWLKSTDGGTTWENEGTASPFYYELGEQTAPPTVGDEVKYKLTVQCNTDPAEESTVETFTTGKIYCTPSHTLSSDYTSALSITSSSPAINYTGSAQTGTTGYRDFTDSTDQVITQVAGSSFDFSHTYYSGSNTIKIWVDWNDNGIFEETELMYNQYSSSGTQNGSFTLLPTPGTYRMRLRASWSSVAEACNSVGYGQAFDFKLVLTPQSTCAGETISAGTISVSPSIDEAGKEYSVTATGSSNYIGLTHQWQKSIDGGANWTDEETATPFYTSLTQTATGNFGDAVQYRLSVQCNSDLPVFSNVQAFTIGYCSPKGLTSNSAYYVSAITTSGAVQDLNYTANSGVEYIDLYDTETVIVEPGNAFDFTINQSTGTGYFYVWVDLDNDGIFGNTPGEVIMATTDYELNISGQIAIPSGFPEGEYRVRVSNSWSGENTVCGPAANGNYVDFKLKVHTIIDCAGETISAGTVTISPENANETEAYNVTASDYSYLYTGLTFQWLKSTDNGTTWENQGDASPSYYNPEEQTAPAFGQTVQYKLTVQCNTDIPEESDIKTFTTHKVHCTPEGLTGNQTNYVSSFTTTNAATNMTAYTATTGVGYVDEYANLSVTAYPSSSFNFNIAQNTGTGRFYVWIDLNDNGIFGDTPEEVIMATTTFATNQSGTVTIPGNVALGDYRMRVANKPTGTLTSPCGPSTNGNFVDFKVTVVAPPTCAGETINASTITVDPQNGNSESVHNITIDEYPIYSDLTFQWLTSTDGGTTWDNLGAASSFYTQLGEQSAPAFGTTIQYQLSVQCNTDVPIESNIDAFTTGYCTPQGLTTSSTNYVSSFTTTNAVTNMTAYTATTGVGYVDEYANLSVTVLSGSTFDFEIAQNALTGRFYVWADFNNNGLFGDTPEEIIMATTTLSANATGQITVPSGLAAGDYRMRVANKRSGTLNSSCGPNTNGNFVDFKVTVIAPPTCAGETVLAGTVTIAPESANEGEVYNVTATGYSNYTGLTFQWLKSTDGGTTWDNEGTSSPYYYPIDEQTAAAFGSTVQYKLTVQCNADPAEESDVKTFTTHKVHCTPQGLTTNSNYYVSNFSTTNALTDLTPYVATSGVGYVNEYDNNSVTVYPNSTFDFSIKQNSSTARFYVWVDFNDNGIFGDTPEEVIMATTSFASTQAGQITIPYGFPAGDYRIRVANKFSGTLDSPCGPSTNGNFVDFKLIVQTPPTCAGETVLAGTVTIDPEQANAGALYNVTATDYSIYTGLTYQWLKSTDNGTTWDLEGTASPSYYDPVAQTAPVFGQTVQYKLSVQCNAETPEESEVKTFTTHKEYCTPTGLTGTGFYYVSSIKTTGAYIDANYTANSGVGYVDAYNTDMVVVEPGNSFNIQVEQSLSFGNFYVWVDLNQNGVFGDTPNEIIVSTTSTFPNASGSITIPTGFPEGDYRVRVASKWNTTLDSNCEPNVNGNYVDIKLKVLTVLTCAGETISAGTITVDPIEGNPNSQYNVTAADYSIYTGLTYQWLKSTDGGANWTNEGTSSSIYAPLIGQVAPANIGDVVHYKLTVQCNTDPAEESVPEQFETKLIYCTPQGLTSSQSYYISAFNTTGALLDVNYTANSPVGYVDNYNTQMILVEPNTTFDFTMNVNNTYTAYFYVWADLNGNGTFGDTPEEIIMATTSYAASQTGQITIPNGFPEGEYRVRIATSGSGSISSPCGPANYGTFVDIKLKVHTLTDCTGETISAGTVTVSPEEANASELYDVAANGFSIYTNLTYQWIKSTDGGANWTNEGISSSTYAPLTGLVAAGSVGDEVQYKLTVQCNTDPAIESTVGTFKTGKVYCIPSYNYTGDYTSALSITSTSPAINYTGSSSTGGTYSDFTEDANYIITQVAGSDFQFTHTHGGGTSNTIKIWVDWNDNGIFEETELEYNQYSGVVTQNGSFTFSPTPGTYRMRFRTVWSTNTLDACNQASYGQTFDFKIVLTTPPTCTGETISAGTISTNPSEEQIGTTYTVTSSGYSVYSDMSYQWLKSTDGGATWGNEGTSSPYYSSLTQVATGNLGDSIQYKLTAQCNTDTPDTSNVATFKNGYCETTTTYTGDYTSKFKTSNGVSEAEYTASSQTGNGYSNLTAVDTCIITRVPGSNVEFTHTYVGGSHILRMWVDWDKNGVFEDSEEVYNFLTSVATKDSSFTLPGNTPAGTYRMRLRSVYTLSAITVDPCNIHSYGQTLDFSLVITSCDGYAGTVQDTSVCQGLTLVLKSSETNSTAKWKSNTPDKATIDETSGLLTGIEAGEAEIVYFLTNPQGCIDSTTAKVTVVAPFTVNITGYPSNDTLVSGQTYQYVSDGTVGTWGSTQSFVATVDPSSGLVTAKDVADTMSTFITYTETSVCLVNAQRQLTVVPKPKDTPNPTPPDSSDKTGITDIELLSSVFVFPNPASDEVNVEFTLKNSANVIVELVDLNGKILYTRTLAHLNNGTHELNVNVSDFASGIYSVILRSDHSITTKKLVITR